MSWDVLAFCRETPATHERISPEQFGTLVQFDCLCDTYWPVWVALVEGRPVAWYSEYEELAGVFSA